MLLTVTALNGSVAITDPNPIEGVLSIDLDAGKSFSGDVTTGQLQRIMPFLVELETRYVKGVGPLMTWSLAHDAGVDDRGEMSQLSSLPRLHQLVGGGLNPAGVADAHFVGTKLLADQSFATLLIGAPGAGAVLYTATLPGAGSNVIRVWHKVHGLSTALSVSVTGNDITVNVHTDGGGVAISTGAEIATAIAASAAAAALVTAFVPTAGTAFGNAALTYLQNVSLAIGAGGGAIRYLSAVAGVSSEAVRVWHKVAGISTTLSVSVVGHDVTVNLGTDGAGVANSTAAAVVAAVAASAAAAALVVGIVLASGTAQGNAALAYLTLGQGDGVLVRVAGALSTVISITDTDLHVIVPNISGTVATSDCIVVTLRSGGQVAFISLPAYTGSVGAGSVDATALASSAVTTAKIAAAAVTIAKLDPLVLAVVEKTIANAALKTLHTTAVEVIPAPSAGSYIELVSVHAYMKYATAAFDSVAATDYLELRSTNASGELLTQNVDPTGFADQATDQHRQLSLAIGAAHLVTPVDGANVVAHIAGSEWYAAAGGGELHLEVLYRVRTTAI